MRSNRSILNLGRVLSAVVAGALLIGGCSSEVHSPDTTVTGVLPPVVCGTQIVTAVTVQGSGFTPLVINTLAGTTGLQLPSVLLTQRSSDDGAAVSGSDIAVYDGANQTKIGSGSRVRWQSAQQMSFDVYPLMNGDDPQNMVAGTDLKFGLYDVSIQNPDGRRSTLQSALAVVRPPQVMQVAPNPACNATGMASFTVSGSNFLQINNDLPTVTFTSIAGLSQSLTMTATTATNCVPLLAPSGVTLQSCSTLAVSVSQNALNPDDYKVTVTNPGNANCASQEDVRTVVVPPPTVTVAQNLAVCSIADTTLQLTGTNFLLLASPAAAPTIMINGMTFATTVDPASCAAITDAPNGRLCTSLSVTIPKGALPIGMYSATLQNPGEAACHVVLGIPINVVDAPTVDPAKGLPNPNPNPLSICTGGGQLSITGEGIFSGATLLVGGFPSTSITVTTTGQTVNGQPQQLATGQFSGPIPLTGGTLADVTIQNAPGCSATLPMVETVSNGPSILFVDPPIIPSIINIQATVYASGVSAPVQKVQVFPSGSTTAILTFTVATNPPLVLDAAFANRVLIPLQAGKLPAGTYDIGLSDQTTCGAFLPAAFKVVATPTLNVTSVTPAFGSTALNTAVVLAGAGFVSIPRVYLSPNSGVGNAQAMSAVTFTSATSLNGVVLSGLNTGPYDAVVVNPDGAFGIAKKAFTVTAANQPPPIITSIAPSSVVTGTATAVIVNGSGFRTGATLTMTCYDANNNLVVGAAAGVTSVGSSGNTINASITGVGSYCIVRATNSDGTYFDFSAVGVTNASLNLTGFKAGNNLTIGRRALAAVAGRPTAVARFVYAIGGDGGADNAPKASVEAAPTALNGNLGSFSVLSQPLPKALSFLGATVIGRFIYSVGGFDGAAAAKDVYRAEILSPLNAPSITDANVTYNATSGLSSGVYIYRVSAVLGGTDANNPNGETLAGDFFPIQLPKLAQGFLRVQLIWPTVKDTSGAGAVTYKVYRSPMVNGSAGTEKLLMTATGVAAAMTQSVTDDGSITPSGAAPLPTGSTGTWKTLPTLATARAGAAVGAAQDPALPGTFYLYAAGGNSGTIAAPAPLNTVEFLPITIANTGNVQTQAVTTWTAATSRLSAGRWLASGLPATSANNSVVTSPTATYFYVASGSSSGISALEKTIESALVLSGGQLGAFAGSGSVGMRRPAYGGALVNNQMMSFGGLQAGAATTASETATLSNATMVGNFNALGGGVLLQPRALQGTALESAFIYQLGGANAGINTAQVSTEQTIW